MDVNWMFRNVFVCVIVINNNIIIVNFVKLIIILRKCVTVYHNLQQSDLQLEI